MVPPFHANPDNHHCLQCTLRMALEALLPGQDWSIDRLDRMTHKRDGEGTWTHGAYLAVGPLDIQTIAYDRFDYAAFIANPLLTVLNTFPASVAHGMAQGFDLVAAAALARELVASDPVPLRTEPVTLEHLDTLLNEGYLLIVNVDMSTLDGGDQPSGHSVLVYDKQGEHYIAHDPGVRGKGVAGRRISSADLEAAWSFMGEQHREVLALRGSTNE
ncbi:MAG: hypothetical protein AB8H79_09395 [Myxococcota bacterium]